MSKFKVGEKVFLSSKSTPNLNGVYKIQWVDYDPNQSDFEDEGFIYGIGVAGANGRDSWYESALKKIVPWHKKLFSNN